MKPRNIMEISSVAFLSLPHQCILDVWGQITCPFNSQVFRERGTSSKPGLNLEDEFLDFKTDAIMK